MSYSVDAVTIPHTRSERGNIAEVARMAGPAVLQFLSDSMMQMVDAAIVGRLGVMQLGAIGFGGVWVWTLVCAFVGIGSGVSTFVSQAHGAGKPKEAGRWMWQAGYALVPVATVWAVLVGLSFEPLLLRLGASPEMSHMASDYAHGRLCGTPALIIAVVASAFLRGLGDTRTPMLVTIFANVVNFVLAYTLVFGRFGFPALGMFGAGIATALANWSYCFVVATLVLRRHMRRQFGTAPCRPSFRDMRRFAWTSVPVGGQWVLDMTSFAIFSTIIARMGEVSMAANQAMIQLLSIAFMQAYGLSIASGALVGRYIGARDLDAAVRTHRSALKLGLGLSCAVAVLFLAIPETLLQIFTSDERVLALGRPLLALGALFQVIDVVGIIVGGSLRGAGDTRFPFVAQTLLAWFLRIPLVYVMAITLQRGVTGAWFGELGYLLVLNAVQWWRFQGGAWRSIRI